MRSWNVNKKFEKTLHTHFVNKLLAIANGVSAGAENGWYTDNYTM